MNTEDLIHKISRVLRRERPAFVAVKSCKQLTAGASQETYRLELETSDGDVLMALRRQPPGQLAVAGEALAIGAAEEAELFNLARAAHVPSPEIVYSLQPNDDLGEGFLMEWLEGETLGQRIVRGEEYAKVRTTLAAECGTQLARIHAIDLSDSRLKDALPKQKPAELIEQSYLIYQSLAVPMPMIEFTANWLRNNIPSESRSCLVHGDFRNGNLMINANGLNAVLDWELAHIGDPVRDLGWLCVNSWRFGQADKVVGGFGEIDELLDAYRAESGVEVRREDVLFWQVFGSYWWSVATLLMAQGWRSGETPSLERPVIGRRSSEAQMDCVNLIIPGTFTVPDALQALSDGTQLPMAAEMLSSVAEFLKQEVAEALSGKQQFLARVGANALGIAQREAQFGPALHAAEHKRLGSLLGKDGRLDDLRWTLTTMLSEGAAIEEGALAEHLRLTVAGQLFIDQPKYSALRAAT